MLILPLFRPSDRSAIPGDEKPCGQENLVSFLETNRSKEGEVQFVHFLHCLLCKILSPTSLIDFLHQIEIVFCLSFIQTDMKQIFPASSNELRQYYSKLQDTCDEASKGKW